MGFRRELEHHHARERYPAAGSLVFMGCATLEQAGHASGVNGGNHDLGV